MTFRSESSLIRFLLNSTFLAIAKKYIFSLFFEKCLVTGFILSSLV